MDLDNIGGLMDFAGHPEKRLRVVHVAGTNGKGSTCAAIASVLFAAGKDVGLYTSPHIESFTERIKINGRQISGEDVASLTEFFVTEIERLKATFFEATTAIMFKYFADSHIDVAVVETGMGGRLDATNIVDPIVSVITGIGLDHTEILGNTVEKIAFEKAGIIKPRRPSIVNSKNNSVMDVFRNVSRERSSPLFFVDEVTSHSNTLMELESSVLDAEAFGTKYPSLKIGLGGRHQMENGMTALATVQMMMKSGESIAEEAVYRGFGNISENTGHRGRLEVLSRDPLVILDVAHNPDGIDALLDSLDLLSGKKGTLLFGAMRDKDSRTMLEHLRQRFGRVILTQLRIGRSLDEKELKKLTDDIKLSSQVFDNSAEALRSALNQTDTDEFILITGSHYLAGEVLPILEKVAMHPEDP